MYAEQTKNTLKISCMFVSININEIRLNGNKQYPINEHI